MASLRNSFYTKSILHSLFEVILLNHKLIISAILCRWTVLEIMVRDCRDILGRVWSDSCHRLRHHHLRHHRHHHLRHHHHHRLPNHNNGDQKLDQGVNFNLFLQWTVWQHLHLHSTLTLTRASHRREQNSDANSDNEKDFMIIILIILEFSSYSWLSRYRLEAARPYLGVEAPRASHLHCRAHLFRRSVLLQ